MRCSYCRTQFEAHVGDTVECIRTADPAPPASVVIKVNGEVVHRCARGVADDMKTRCWAHLGLRSTYEHGGRGHWSVTCALPSGHDGEHTPFAVTPSFEAIDMVYIEGRGRVYVTYAGDYRDLLAFLPGHDVLIDGQLQYVTGVERFAIGGPYPAHFKIGLLVREPS